MRRFILPSPLPESGELTLNGELYRHIVTVLRLKPGQDLQLVTPSGDTAPATIMTAGNGTVTLRLGQHTTASTGSRLRIVLYQGMPKGDKLELIIQKATELGVTRIIPYAAERSVVKIFGDRLAERSARWNRIAAEAARQSGAIVPQVVPAANLVEALASCDADLRLLPWEDEQAGKLHPLLATIPAPTSVAIVVGPEGGFSPAEVAAARSHGFLTVRLGPRILRTETAGFTLAAIVQYAWGDLE
jgi:16S rRNA (uracil1498-N3)-methyltransferase